MASSPQLPENCATLTNSHLEHMVQYTGIVVQLFCVSRSASLFRITSPRGIKPDKITHTPVRRSPLLEKR